MKKLGTSADQGNRLVISPFLLNVLVASYLMAVCNATFWARLLQIFDGHLLAGLVLAAAVWALMLLVISILAVWWVQKPVLVALLVIAGVTSFYMDNLGVMIDREMIQNAATTTVAESKHLITPNFLFHVAFFGLLPAAVVIWVKIRRIAPWHRLGGWVVAIIGTAALVIGLLMTNFKSYSSTLRSHRELMGSVQPLAPINGAVQYVQMMLGSANIVVAPIGLDAKKGPMLAAAKKPVLMVIVAGETARAQNWSLGGYARQTNPELAKRDILYFSQATSCGTATATSLPCMFSPLTRDQYSFEGGLSNENLLDVLAHAGIKVEWWENNTGDKKVAARLPSRFMTAADGAEFCTPECIDGVFLKRLQMVAETMTEDTAIVVHQIGSHGPSYWLRYPPDREVFKPACKTPELSNCSTEEIVNAYDNTMAYTDYILARMIDQLGGQDRVIPALYYVSDHGESLGENGIFLHGTPYFMAPEVQTRVPMVIWMSPEFQTTLGIDQGCLAGKSGEAVSHDNMFSTILGMMDITTAARDETLDLVSPCRVKGN